ncbi:MAG: hypothetical protein KDD03_00845 [Gelidibacter sp.]|nr:hypothetical protein [Gelidibacter sp.]
MGRRALVVSYPVVPIIHRFGTEPVTIPNEGEMDIPIGVYKIIGPYNLSMNYVGWEIDDFENFLEIGNVSHYNGRTYLNKRFWVYYNLGYRFHILTSVVEKLDAKARQLNKKR